MTTEPRTMAPRPAPGDKREFMHADQALRVAAMLAASGSRCKVGRDPGKPWHVTIC